VYHRKQRVCTVPPLIHTVVAETPSAFVTEIALPIAGVSKFEAHVTEHA
jgi:hypothetical protein